MIAVRSFDGCRSSGVFAVELEVARVTHQSSFACEQVPAIPTESADAVTWHEITRQDLLFVKMKLLRFSRLSSMESQSCGLSSDRLAE